MNQKPMCQGRVRRNILWTGQHALMLIKLCLNLGHVFSFMQVKGCRFTSSAEFSVPILIITVTSWKWMNTWWYGCISIRGESFDRLAHHSLWQSSVWEETFCQRTVGYITGTCRTQKCDECGTVCVHQCDLTITTVDHFIKWLQKTTWEIKTFS